MTATVKAEKKKGGFGSKFTRFWHNITSNPSVTVKETLGYSAGLLGNSAAQDVEAFALTLFLTRFMGIGAAYVLILELVAKIANVIADPIAGLILDRKTKNGRSMAKIFSLITPFPLAVSSILLFVVPKIGFTQRVIYVFVFYLIYIFCDSFYDMSIQTIAARMTSNPKDRKNFYTVAQFAETLGGMLPSGFIPIFVAAYAEKEQFIYLAFAIVFGIIGFFFMIVPAFTLRDKTEFKYIRKTEKKVQLSFKALALNRPMWMLILATLFDSLRQVTYTGLAYFYLETLDAFWMASLVGTVSSYLSYAGILLVPIICRKWSARDVIMGGYAYTGVFYLILLLCGRYILDARPFWLITLCIGLAGLPNGAMSSCRKILLADSSDYMEYKTWKKYGEPVRSEAMIFATNSTANRVKTLFKSSLFPIGLLIIGYVSAYSFGNSTIQVIQSENVLRGIFYLITICGIAGNFIPAAFMLLDNFHGKKKEALMSELEEMRLARLKEYEMKKKLDFESPKKFGTSNKEVKSSKGK